MRWDVAVQGTTVTKDHVDAPCSAWNGRQPHPHGLDEAGGLLVGVGAIDPDVAVGGDWTDFAEHNWKLNWPAKLLGQITESNLL